MSNQEFLHSIESAIIEKMAKNVGVQAFQMKSMIKRCAELKAYYHQVREQVITEMAA